MRVRILFSTIVLALSANANNSGRITKGEYVDAWSTIAISEMINHRIPASITLAQGILESGSGNSDLAQKANNHFGIKCHSDWKGGKYFMDDDAENECFRVYDNAEASFIDHSLFLTSKKRYEGLFALELTDYKAWAKGLKDAGYATNPKYPELLITIIEDLDLAKFDQIGNQNNKGNLLAFNSKSKNSVNTPKTAEVFVASKHSLQLHENKVKYVIAKKGDTYYKIAKEFNLGLWQLYRYNDLDEGKDVLEEGDVVYIQPKRKRTKKDFVVVDKEMTYSQLSQLEAIKLERIIKLNNIDHKNETVRPGQKVILR